MNSSFAIYTNNVEKNTGTITAIKSFISQEYPVSDFVVFSNDTHHFIDSTALLVEFYMIGFTGNIIFLDPNDYLVHKDKISEDRTILYVDSVDSLLENNITKNSIKNVRLITVTNNELVWVNNHGL